MKTPETRALAPKRKGQEGTDEGIEIGFHQRRVQGAPPVNAKEEKKPRGQSHKKRAQALPAQVEEGH